MQFFRAIATGADLEAACRDAAATVRSQAGAAPFDFTLVFASPRYGALIDRLPVLMHEALPTRALVGCSAAVVVDEQRSVEGRHAIAVLAGRLPNTRVDMVAIANADLPSPDAGPAAWRALFPECAGPRTGMIVLGEPYHGDPAALLAGLDFGFPGVTKVGGIASGSRHPEGHVLFCGRQAHRSGAVVLALAGEVGLDGIVAPGCRPFGCAGRVTKARDHRLLEIDGAPARTFVRKQLAALSGEERAVAQTSPLLLGLAPDPFEPGDAADAGFLVRSILGIDADGEFVTCRHLPVGRSIRLLMRDREAGVDSLRRNLGRSDAASAQAAVLFQCLGRSSDDHREFAAAAPHVPLVGFHCNGEIGPLAGQTHLHSYSAAFGIFRPQRPR